MNIKKLTLLVLSLLLAGSAAARVEFALNEYPVIEFRALDRVTEACASPVASSFWCEHQNDTLMQIPTKGADFFFSDSGELFAVFAKPQKGQVINNHALNNNQNLIPVEASIPGNAFMVDGEYYDPEDVSNEWEVLSDTEIQGTFEFTAGGFDVTRTVVVSNITHTLTTTLEVERLEDGAEEATIQLAFPGISNVDSPTVKVGQAESFSPNPLSQSVENVSYLSVQSNDRNSGFAIVMRPAGSGDVTEIAIDDAVQTPVEETALSGISLGDYRIAMERPIGAEAGSSMSMVVETYTGPNELVRYTQEGYADLPGLFNPNILGRLSLGLIWLLVWIHDYVPSWGLSIIILTLIFRALIWPLITTQSKSMFAMQQMQPKLQALQKKYKDDREKLAQEQMKMYKEEGVNPAGGCLPMILQMPLFIILWRVFVNFEFNEGFLWLPDLGSPDPFYILPILSVGVMFLQSYFSTKGNPNMLRQQIFINLIFVFIIVNFPAGVILYFVVSMLVQVFQYWLISRQRPAAPAVATTK